MPRVGDAQAIGCKRRVVPFSKDLFLGPIRLDAGHLWFISMFAEDDPLSARSLLPARHVTDGGGPIEPAHVGAIRTADPQVGGAFTIGHEADLPGIGRPARVSVF